MGKLGSPIALSLDHLGNKAIKQTHKYYVIVHDSVRLAANASVILFVKIKNVSKDFIIGDKLFIPTNYDLSKKNILCGTAIVSVNANFSIPVKVFNANDHSVIIKRNTLLGCLEDFFPSDGNVAELELMKETSKSLTIDELLNYHLSSHERSSTTKKNLEKILREYFSVFSRNKMDLGVSNIINHRINTGNTKPIACLPRRIPQAFEEKIDELVDDLLTKGIIEESDSPWNSPIVVVKKKNGDIRMCIDFRRINQYTERPIYLIPESKQIFDCLSNNSVFSTIDFSQGYYQVEMNTSDKKKTAFTTRKGHFQFKRMPFGLSGAPATFQKLMNKLLEKENWFSCLIYLDDIVIFGKNECEHNKRLCDILKKIQDSGLKLSPFKCEFCVSQINFLGHTISKDGISTDVNKIKAIKEWKKPVTENELVSFLGFCSYYRKFIKGFAELTYSLEQICRKKSKDKIVWNNRAEKDFEYLKTCLTSPPVLTFPKPGCKYILDTDASSIATGAVLSQIQNGEEKVIAYASNILSSAQQKYCTTRREILAVHRYILMFKHYLIGSEFKVRTDHRAITWLLGWQSPNTSQYARWKADLEIFGNFEVIHRKGEDHKNADFLSRPQCEQCSLLHDDPKRRRNVKLFQEDDIFNSMVFKICVDDKYINENQSKDKDIQLITQLMRRKLLNENCPQAIISANKNVKQLWKIRKHLRLRGDVLYLLDHKNDSYRIIVPEFKRLELIDKYHRSMCHFGCNKISSAMAEKYYWPNMEFEIRLRIASCKTCQLTKKNKYGTTPSQSITTNFPFEKICMDITGPLPVSKRGNKYILSIVDYFSRYPMLIPIKTIDAKTVTRALMKNWIAIFGVPMSIHSDRGTNFESELMYELCRWLGTTKTRSKRPTTLHQILL